MEINNILFYLIPFIGVLAFGANIFGKDNIRRSILAGSWYPASKPALVSDIDRYLAKASIEPVDNESRVFAIISPHAGYMYSGEAAAHGYKLISSQRNISRAVILCPSHHWGFRGASVIDVDYYETPIGNIKVDSQIVKELLKKEMFDSIPYADMREHSLEIQLPFLQETLSGGFKIVPIVIGQLKPEDCAKIANGIKPFIDDNTVVVISSDFTHFGDNFGYKPFSDNIKDNLKKLDGGAVDKILNKDFVGFRKYLSDTGITICGADPISILIKLLPDNAKGKKLIYYTSGEVTGGYDSTVSYVSIAFTVPKNPVVNKSTVGSDKK